MVLGTVWCQTLGLGRPRTGYPHEVHSRKGDRQVITQVIRARCCPGNDDGRLPGGGDSKLEFEKSYSFSKYLSHTYLGPSAIFTRLME